MEGKQHPAGAGTAIASKRRPATAPGKKHLTTVMSSDSACIPSEAQ